MTIAEASAHVDGLTARMADNDHLFVVAFSGDEDQFQAWDTGIDAGDALVIVNGLIARFNLSREAIAASV